ncbi:hypothetical protein LX87_05510 [Larkinella arboricola]|uniref:Uncharacterized protein n=1 Tax=Larkinella arboricola TaxID=643671 RepID=A0A327WGT9_LARAB|nr:hypothetical protein [Larkinella arboricola]RAJ90081.1 hypothetical protein LX87_05510 [Larkinella arboricola]
MKQFLLSILFCIGITSELLAQDVIYTANGNKLENAQLTGVTEDKISFTAQRAEKTSSFSFQRQNVLIAFSQTGHFLIIKDLSADLSQAQQQLQAFLSAPARSKEKDFLIKAVPLTVIPASISYESESVVNYQNSDGKSASISKGELVAILYRDGRHQLIHDPTEAAPLLSSVKKQIESGITTAKSQPEATAPAQTPSQQLANLTPPAQTVASQPANESKPEPAQQEHSSKPMVTGNKPALNEAEYQIYRKKALQKVDEFVSYLNVITDKKLSLYEKDKAIVEAAKLFMPAATIEVTSNNRIGSRRYPIRDYLTRLKLLPYSSAKIEWSEVQYIKELSQAADGNYYGIITGQQTFIGYGSQGDNPIYSDVTQKNVRVKLQSYEKTVNGNTSVNWDVLLGSIGVATK